MKLSIRDFAEYIAEKMSKLPGPSRIPTFGTKCSAQKPIPKQVAVVPVTPADVGSRVTAVGKIGTLRFIGEVHFASDVWCGIELDTDVGKNDGSVDGVRYFSCSRSRGLMTPLSKVSIYDDKGKPTLADNRTEKSIHKLHKNGTFEVKQDAANSISGKDVNLEVLDDKTAGNRRERSRLALPQVKNVLIREKTFDKEERDRSKKIKRSDTYDKNDNDLSNRKETLDNNNTVKRSENSGEELICSRSNIEYAIFTPRFTASPIASTSRNDNGNSLLLLDAFDKSTPKIHSEFFESTSSNEISSGQNTKFSETLQPSTNSESSFKPSQILVSKENKDIDTNTVFNGIDSSKIDNRELATQNQNVMNFIFNSQEEENKRDSLDLDESLEILSVSQMNDGFSVVDSHFGIDEMNQQEYKSPSPLPISNFDLILQENAGLISETTINLELTLDTVDKSNFQCGRLEETPSPEELPLDPIPIIESELRNDSTKSKTNSFITSITSITSLDTGYQGDGEMSRPGSRGADNSPLTRRPLQRPSVRRNDVMTDSDFFTESDADNHDDNVLRGDRRAQVIDGTLYGVDPQAAADIYVNNRENMDSSGVFTDIESNTRAEELLIDENIDISPSDTSSKTLSENSQNNLQEVIAKNLANSEIKKKDTLVESKTKTNGSTPVITDISTKTNSVRDETNNKYKTPKRENLSKVQSMNNANMSKPEDKSTRKPVGRWNAVMSKISKTDSKTNFQEVKSRVFSNVNSRPRTNQNSAGDQKKQGSPRQVNNQKSTNNKLRRVRTRILNTPQSSKNSNGESIHSSLSDLSGSAPKKTVGSIKRKDVPQVTHVLTATAKLSPKLSQQTVYTDAKRRIPTAASAEKGPKKCIFPPKEKKLIPSRENGRTTVKGGRTSPVIRSPTSARSTKKPAPRTAEALAVLVQHLVFNVEAFEVPNLRKQVKKFQQEAEEVRLAYQQIKERLLKEKQEQESSLEEERLRWREDIAHLIDNHHSQLSHITNEKKEFEENLLHQQENFKTEIQQQYEDKLSTLKREFEKLQKTHEESLDILREENEAIREDIDVKNEEIRDAKHESRKLREDYHTKETLLKEQIQLLSRENQKFKQDLAACREEIAKLEEERLRLLEENKRLLSYGEGKGIGVQEVESLRVVLELKQNEVSELRKTVLEATQKADILAGCQEKAAALQARCEDLELQLQRKNDYEMGILADNKRLEQSLHEETNQRRSLLLRNEELQWKLKQNKEVITKILEQTNEDVFNKTESTLSTSDRYLSNTSLNLSLKSFSPSPVRSCEKSLKKLKKEKVSLEEFESPPTSPKIKGVVEKSDSVSYVLDLDESPDVVASRLVRRSFRNSLTQKNTPTKSPCNNKRPRIKGNPLSQSSSASSIITTKKTEYNRSRSVSMRNEDQDLEDDYNFSDNSSSTSPYHYSNLKLDESPECQKNDHGDLDYLDDHLLDLNLPSLPSELGCKVGVQALPMPKHLAGEAMVSESNSEDESTSSSSGQL